ncbi:hypothetical protein GALMADRAFT_144603 [Galerina marginata CBS 339.88]|uniref:F-box domain-containing protein n=1 Tax=Galerina marginata (strain CBS 339.88) TaxID=685588 RepID=A0A067SIE5_GALM3|nr:hypothetical protein GALMADRAFT_144603 [Galerina marginata CBS 339.88]
MKSIRLASKVLNAAESFIFRTLTFDINATNLSTNIEKLQWLSRQSPVAPRATKKLVIKCLAPEYDPEYEPETYINGQWVPTPLPCERSDIIIAKRRLRKYLYSALTSLRSVCSVQWTTHPKDDEWAQHATFKSFSSLPRLSALQINIDWIQNPLPIHHLLTLRFINLKQTGRSASKGHAYQTYLNLGKMVAHSAHLTSIKLERGDYDSQHADPSASLHQLLSLCSTGSSTLRLQNLALNRMFVKLDQTTSPHLRHLKSLDLSNMLEPYNPRNHEDIHTTLLRNEMNVDDLNKLHTKQCMVGSTINEVWVALIPLGLRLEEITLTDVTPGFLDYLETYSGLRKLRMRTTHRFKPSISPAPLANRFFEVSLGRHVNTLEELDIQASFGSTWCFVTHNMHAVSSYKKVKTFGISISGRRLEKPNTVNLLLDTVSQSLPHLHTLKLSIAAGTDLDTVNWESCWPLSSPSISSVNDIIAASLATYSSPSSSREPWVMEKEVGGRFLLHRSDRRQI